MKLSKSALLTIALFGASASIFSYAKVYSVTGSDAEQRGNSFKNLLKTQFENGDQIVFDGDISLSRQLGKLDIPAVTIKSSNGSKLYIEGANLNLTGTAKFENLKLSLKPDVGLNNAFSGLGVSGPNAQPSLIVTNGYSLTLDKVDTKVDGDNDGTRPIILVGGGNSATPEVLTVTNSTTESKLYSIVVDKTKQLNTTGNGFTENKNTTEKEITINLDSNSRVLNEINLAGIDKTQAPNNKISINSETLNIGNIRGSGTDDGIRIGGATNVNLAFSNVTNTVSAVKFIDTQNINLKSLVLDKAEIVLKKNANIETLELKNHATLSVESTGGNNWDDDDISINYKVDVGTLKTDTNINTLKIVGNSDSSIEVKTFDGDITNTKVSGNTKNFTLTDSNYTFDNKNNSFTSKPSTDPNTSTLNPGSSTSAPDSSNSAGGAGTSLDGNQTDGANGTTDGDSASTPPTTTLSPAEPSPPPAAQTQDGQSAEPSKETEEKKEENASSGDSQPSGEGAQVDNQQGGESQGTEGASQDGKEGEQTQDSKDQDSHTAQGENGNTQSEKQENASGQDASDSSNGQTDSQAPSSTNTDAQADGQSTDEQAGNQGTSEVDEGNQSGTGVGGEAGASSASSGDAGTAGAAAGSTSESQDASSSESSQGTGGSTAEGVGSSSSTVESSGSGDTETAAGGNGTTDQTAGDKTPAAPAGDPNSPPSNSRTPSQPTGETPSVGSGSSQPNSGNGSESSVPSTTAPSEGGANSGTTTPTPADPATPPTTSTTQPGEQPESTPPSSGEGEEVEGAQNQGDETSPQGEKEEEKKQEQGAGGQADGQTAGEQGSSGTGVGGAAESGTEVGSGGAASGSSDAGGSTGAEGGAGGSQGSETSAGGSGSGVVDSGSGSSDSKDTTAGTTNATDQAESGEHKEENGTQTGKEGEQANQTQDSEASPSKDEGSNPQSTPQGTEQPQSGDSNPQSPSTTEGDKEKTDPPAVTPVSPSGDSNTSTEDTREETEADSGKDKDGTEGGKDANLGGDTPEKNPDAPQTGTTTADTPQADGSHTVGENQGGDANGTQDDKGQDGDNVTPPAKPEVPPKDQSAVENQGDSKPSKPVADKPAVEQPAADKPVEQPAEEKPTAEKPTAEKPTEEKPAAEKPAAEKPAAEKPAAEKPAAEKPAKEKPAEKSIKDRIIDTLKDWFGNAGLNDEKQQAQVAEKVENSLQELTTSYSDYGLSFTADAARVADNRLNDLASLNGLESAATDNYAFLAQSARALKTRNSVWVSSSLGEQRGDSDSKRRSHSINLGYDRQFDNLILGGFVSYLGQKGERGELNSKLHGYAFSLYGKYSQDAHEIVALLNAGRTSAELKRNISALDVSNQADVKGKFAGLRAEYGYRMVFEQHGLQVKPIIAVNYNIGRQADFTERGSMPVHVGSIKAQRFAVEAGVELKKYFETAYVYIKPTVQTDLMARSNDVDIRFVNLPNSIPFKSATKKKTSFALSLGTQVQLRRNLLLDLNANSRFAKNERDVQGNVKLSYKF